MATPAARKSLHAVQALALLAIVVFHLIKGPATTPGEVTLDVGLAMALCLASSFLLFGVRFGLAAFLAAYVLSWTAEELGVRTGVIFGKYHYTEVLGPKLGSVPYVIPVYWFLILYSAYVITALILRRGQAAAPGAFNLVWRSLLVALVATSFDLVLDPYMVYRVKAWVWEGMKLDEGYFGVPPHNYYGWICTAFVLALLLQWLHSRFGTVPGSPRTLLTILAPVALYASYWLAYSRQGFPDPVRVIALIAMGIPAIAAIASWATLSPRAAEEIAGEIF
jgi:putative membrane protein